MREAQYTDADGLIHAVLLPDQVLDEQAFLGLPIGPPPLDALGLPRALTVRLSNELFFRRVLSEQDAKRRPGDITAALIAALGADAMAIQALYAAPSDLDLPETAPSA